MSLLAKKHADEIREMWQSRALRAATGKLRKVLIVALAKEYPAALTTLMRVTFPGFVDLDAPLLVSYAHIAPDGSVVCDVVKRDGTRRLTRIYDSEDLFIYAMRKLADELKFNDHDRVELFTVLQKWVASDRRLKLVS